MTYIPVEFFPTIIFPLFCIPAIFQPALNIPIELLPLRFIVPPFISIFPLYVIDGTKIKLFFYIITIPNKLSLVAFIVASLTMLESYIFILLYISSL